MTDKQLSLNLELKYDASLSDFSGPGWVMVVDAVRQLHLGLMQQAYVFGGSGTGKSHFLSAVCESYIDFGKTAITLSMRDLLYTDVGVLSSLESFDLIAIDDIDAIEHSLHWQEAIFHLINRTKEQNKQLLFSGSRVASDLPFVLRDLITRLSQAPSFRVPDGQGREDREALLQSILRRRGWQLDDRIIAHLLKEGPHRIGGMMAVLNYIQPMFSNLARVNISKAAINTAIKIIDEQTLLAELESVDTDTNITNVDMLIEEDTQDNDNNIAFDF